MSKITIIGNGNVALATAGHLAQIHDVILYHDKPEHYPSTPEKTRLEVITDERENTSYNVSLTHTSNLERAISDAELVLISISSKVHHSIGIKTRNKKEEGLKKYLQEGQKVTFLPGKFLSSYLLQDTVGANISIGEVSTSPFFAKKTKKNKVFLLNTKKNVEYGNINPEESDKITRYLNDIFEKDIFVPQPNALHVSLRNHDALLNSVSIINCEPAYSEKDGKQQELIPYGSLNRFSIMHLEKMAAERNLICAQLGVEIRSLENFLININEDNVNLSNLYSMMRKTYGKKKIPICPYTDRRLTEDIPCGIVPLAILAKTFFIDTPAINETISIGNELALDYDKNHIDYKQNELFEHYTRIIPQIIG